MTVENRSSVDPRSLLLNRPVGIENLDICRECGGKCCQSHAGCCWPWDFGEPLYDNIRQALESGNYVLDCWRNILNEGFCESYWVRPRHTNKLEGLIDQSWEGTCIFWTELSSCKLPLEERPTVCRISIPRKSHKCDGAKKYDKNEMMEAWLPFQFIFRTLIEEYDEGTLKLKKVVCK